MLPRAEKKMLGTGARDLRLAGHFELSESMRGWRLADDIGSSRRAKARMVGLEEMDVRVVRIWDPYDIV